MLKELNTIASDLLGLHGYPMQPVAWAEIFPVRKRAATAAYTSPAAARTSGKAARVAGARTVMSTRRPACG